ncbi:MAG: tetratricopeptide repeat protein [Deltaproteobacteria bacterium]
MSRQFRIFLLAGLVLLSSPLAATSASGDKQYTASTTAPKELKDLYFGEALYHAFQGEWFDAIARLDTELKQFHGLDEPKRDSLYYHIGQAEFGVGDFELAYRMHQRAGRAIKEVIEGNVEESVRNEALFRLARIYFKKDQPVNGLQVLERIHGTVPDKIRDDVEFLRAQLLIANGRYAEAARILRELQKAKSLEGFATYDLGIALLENGEEQKGRQYLDLTGQIVTDNQVTLAIKDKSNLVLGDKLMQDKNFAGAKVVLDRIRLKGPFSDRALLDSGWANASQGQYERALVPWTILFQREVTDPAVQEAMLALPYAYGKLDHYAHAAKLYGRVLETFGGEIDKLTASIKSIREGNFLKALVREELKQDANWVVKLRSLPDAPETYYLLQLMASNDFQESLKNYLDLEELRKKLAAWEGDLDAYEEIIAIRRAYYKPLLPDIDHRFRQLDSQMRLRLEQRDHIQKRLQAMLTAPHPDFLATANERILKERIDRLQQAIAAGGAAVPSKTEARIKRLQGVLRWRIYTQYDRRLTEAFKDLHELNKAVDLLQRQYNAFVRTRQAATQSYEGYDDTIHRQRFLRQAAEKKVQKLMARQGHMLEVMAVNELIKRRERLAEYQVKARFALADSYDRATRAQNRKKVNK